MVLFIYPIRRRHKPFLASLGYRSSHSYFFKIGVPANLTKVTYRAGLGKSYWFYCSVDTLITYGERHLLVWRKTLTRHIISMEENSY